MIPSSEFNKCFTFVRWIWSLCNKGHQVRIDILVEYRAIAQHTALRVYMLNRIFLGNANDMLFRIVTSQTYIPNGQTSQCL